MKHGSVYSNPVIGPSLVQFDGGVLGTIASFVSVEDFRVFTSFIEEKGTKCSLQFFTDENPVRTVIFLFTGQRVKERMEAFRTDLARALRIQYVLMGVANSDDDSHFVQQSLPLPGAYREGVFDNKYPCEGQPCGNPVLMGP